MWLTCLKREAGFSSMCSGPVGNVLEKSPAPELHSYLCSPRSPPVDSVPSVITGGASVQQAGYE